MHIKAFHKEMGMPHNCRTTWKCVHFSK